MMTTMTIYLLGRAFLWTMDVPYHCAGVDVPRTLDQPWPVLHGLELPEPPGRVLATPGGKERDRVGAITKRSVRSQYLTNITTQRSN
jgi:hypothetical protein